MLRSSRKIFQAETAAAHVKVRKQRHTLHLPGQERRGTGSDGDGDGS
jgi:hypothetical protein